MTGATWKRWGKGQQWVEHLAMQAQVVAVLAEAPMLVGVALPDATVEVAREVVATLT